MCLIGAPPSIFITHLSSNGNYRKASVRGIRFLTEGTIVSAGFASWTAYEVQFISQVVTEDLNSHQLSMSGSSLYGGVIINPGSDSLIFLWKLLRTSGATKDFLFAVGFNNLFCTQTGAWEQTLQSKGKKYVLLVELEKRNFPGRLVDSRIMPHMSTVHVVPATLYRIHFFQKPWL